MKHNGTDTAELATLPFMLSLKANNNILCTSWRHLIDKLWELLLRCDCSHNLSIKIKQTIDYQK